MPAALICNSADDLCYQTQRKRKLSKREIHPGRVRNSTVSGPQAFGQARTLGDMHERTNWRGWETRKEGGWAILNFDQRYPYYLIRSTPHYTLLLITFHVVIPLIYRADLWCSARLAVVRKWFFGGAKEVFSSIALLSPEYSMRTHRADYAASQQHCSPAVQLARASHDFYPLWNIFVATPTVRTTRKDTARRNIRKSHAAPRLALQRWGIPPGWRPR